MEKITPEIAELAGIFAADGSMQKEHLCYWGNIYEDKDHYNYIIKPLFQKSFLIDVNPHEKPSNSVYGFYVCKKEIIKYFNKFLGYPIGSKTYTVRVPQIIMNSPNQKIWSSFIRGFADGDGTLAFDRRYTAAYRKILITLHTYPRVQLKSVSFKLIEDISFLLCKLKIKHITCKIKRDHVGNERNQLLLQISGKPRLEQWIKHVGFNNPVHQTKYDIFKAHGFVPPKTTLAQRKEILQKKIDPLNLYPKNQRDGISSEDLKRLKRNIF